MVGVDKHRVGWLRSGFRVRRSGRGEGEKGSEETTGARYEGEKAEGKAEGGTKEERNTPQAKTFPYKAIHLCRHSISELDMVVVVNGEKGGEKGGRRRGSGEKRRGGERGDRNLQVPSTKGHAWMRRSAAWTRSVPGPTPDERG